MRANRPSSVTDLVPSARSIAPPVASQISQRILEEIDQGICLTDADGTILDVNSRVCGMLGLDRAAVIGRNFRTLLREENIRNLPRDLFSALREGQALAEYRLVTRDGSERTVEAIGKMLSDGCLVWVMQDITERRRLERELLELGRRQESRVGRDLHDRLGQNLAGIGFLIKVLEHKLQAKALAESAELRRIGQLLKESIRQTRDLASGLCPVEFNADGLNTAIGLLCDGARQSVKRPCRFKSCGEVPRLDNITATQIYMIAREALDVAFHHAGASQVTVELAFSGNRTVLTVEDNGDEIPRENRAVALAVRVMRYRAALVGANLSIRRRKRGNALSCVHGETND